MGGDDVNYYSKMIVLVINALPIKSLLDSVSMLLSLILFFFLILITFIIE